MIQKLKTTLLTVFSITSLLTPALFPAVAVAQGPIEGGLDRGTCLTVDDPNCAAGTNTEERVNSIITDVINIFSIVVGVVAVIMIIVGGLKYITSSGDSGNVTSAKNTILYAIIGLVIVALAQVIVRYVLNRVNTV